MEKQDKYKQFETMKSSLLVSKNQNRNLVAQLKDIQNQIKSKSEQLDSFIKEDIKNKKRIAELKDLVSNFQDEIKVLKKPRGIFS